MACLPAGAALLHDLGAVEARQFAESVIAVDDGPLHDLSVAYEEAGLWGTGEGAAQSRHQDPPLEPLLAPQLPAPTSGQRSRTYATPFPLWSQSGKPESPNWVQFKLV